MTPYRDRLNNGDYAPKKAKAETTPSSATTEATTTPVTRRKGKRH